jgi:protein-S-isoprenylcysteine O-methyltransferase Ste14
MNAQTLAGIVLAVASVTLLVLARVQLGKSFAVTPKAKELVTRGLYSRFRHPMYLFLDLAICGVALAVRSWYVMIPLLLVPLQIRGALRENAVLRARFGEQYKAYSRSTWF